MVPSKRLPPIASSSNGRVKSSLGSVPEKVLVAILSEDKSWAFSIVEGIAPKKLFDARFNMVILLPSAISGNLPESSLKLKSRERKLSFSKNFAGTVPNRSFCDAENPSIAFKRATASESWKK
jgi:hypothetical protein